ncbi:MAG TPA: phage tail protein I [Xylella sp.]
MNKPVESLLPPTATPLMRAVEQVMARMADIPIPFKALWDPQTCPEPLLPWLAWSLSVDTWRSDWPVHIKRARIAAAIEIQRCKGSVKSVRDVVRSFGGDMLITEWWQETPPAPPHTFKLILTLSGHGGTETTAGFVSDVITEVMRTKPVRSHFTFTQGVHTLGTVGLIGAARSATYGRLQLTQAA